MTNRWRAEMTSGKKDATTTVPKVANPMTVDGGASIEWTDGKTGTVYATTLAKLGPTVIAWAVRHGRKQSVADSHSAIKDKAEAKTAADARFAKILAGDVSASGTRGPKTDPVVTEAIASLIVASGMTRGAFVKEFGTGAASVAAAVLRLVVNAVATKYDREKADAAFVDGKLNGVTNAQIENVM